MPWAQDNPWSVRALRRLAMGSPVAFQAWMQRFGDGETHASLIDSFASIAFCDESAALRIIQMPFLDDAVGAYFEDSDSQTLDGLARLARSSLGALEEVLSHPGLQGGISDASTTLTLLLVLEQEDAVAAAALRALPWVADGIKYIDFDALPTADYVQDESSQVRGLINTARKPNRSFWALLDKPWVRDGYNWMEWPIIIDLLNMASYDDAGTARVLEMPFLETLSHSDGRITSFLSGVAWERILHGLLSSPKLEGGIRDGDFAIVALAEAELQNPEAAAALDQLGWVQDGIDPSEHNAILSLVTAVAGPDSIFSALITKSWVQDGLTPDESQVVSRLAQMATGASAVAGESTALQILDMPFLQEITSLDVAALSSLQAVMISSAEGVLQQVLSHPELRDGIADEWTSLVAVTWPATWRPGLLDILLDPEQTSINKRIISLPLAGEVTLTVIEPEGAAALSLTQAGSASMDPLDLLEHAVRTQEAFMGVTFPKSELVLFVADVDPVGGSYLGHGLITSDSRSSAPTIAHETGHIWDVTPIWLSRPAAWLGEGAAEFLTAISERTRVGTPLPEPEVSCGLANKIADLVRAGLDSDVIYGSACNYVLGRGLLLELYESLGHSVFRQGFANIYLASMGSTPELHGECSDIDVALCYFRTAFLSGMPTEQGAIADEIITRRYFGMSS